MKKEKKKRLARLKRRTEERKDRRRGKFNDDKNIETVEGVFSMARGGFGFVKLDVPEGEDARKQEVFIPPKYVANAMDGDTVKVAILPPDTRFYDENKGPAGRVVSVVQRQHSSIIGEVIAGNKVRPLNRRLVEDIDIAGPGKSAKRGEWVELKLSDGDEGEPSGRIVRRIGKAGSIQADLDAVCAEYDICRPYNDEENAKFAAVEPRDIPREDMTSACTFTIDPVDAKDFDDAISIEVLSGDEVAVGVHIADVAAFVAPKSDLDKEAGKRGFTAYLPGRTLPMLPRTLTAKISLQQDVVSNAHTVVLTVNRTTGEVKKARRCHSRVRTDRRLNYDEVQAFLDTGKAPATWDEKLKENLRLLLDTTRAMRRRRKQDEDFIDMEIPEIRVIADEAADKVRGLSVKKQREAEFLVEECMLAANSAVGAELDEKDIPGLFRVHPEPEPERIEEFSFEVEDAFGVYPGDLTVRSNCNAFLNKLPDDERKPVILSMLLRSLPRASYLETPQLHFGLGKTRYCHFTSPIRRYTDLAVHQQLWNHDLNQRLKPKSAFAKLALDLSAKEENNDNAYFSASDRLKLRYLAELLGQGAANFYEAVVFKVNSSGLVVEVPDLGVHGFVQKEDLPGDFHRVGTALRSGKREYRAGDFIFLKLYDIDSIRGQALFRPAGTTATAALRAAKAAGTVPSEDEEDGPENPLV